MSMSLGPTRRQRTGWTHTGTHVSLRLATRVGWMMDLGSSELLASRLPMFCYLLAFFKMN